MKIQAINGNTNFKGLFTDKTAENGGNWRMEYRPYSWESANTGKMAPKAQFSVYAKKLPDNEEIYTKSWKSEFHEVSEDILGTKSYYKRQDGSMRRTISEMPSLNREESLKVLDKKLDAFLNMKNEERKVVQGELNKIYEEGTGFAEDYDLANAHYRRSLGWFEGISHNNEVVNTMNDKKFRLNRAFDKMFEASNDYIKLQASIDAVRQTKENGLKEIKQLEELRKADKLIDISRRDIENPNGALIQALKDMRGVVGKYICLPNKLISMDEFLKSINPKNIASFSQDEVTRQVEKLFKNII